MVNLRKAHSDDAKLVSTIAEATFRDTFAGANTPEDIDLHCRTSFGEAIQAKEIGDPNMATFVCDHGGSPVGFAQLRWRGAPPCVPGSAPGEIRRLYVVRDFHGKGVAHALMKACMQEMAGRRSDVVWLGVWERNLRAIAFYRNSGFLEVGEHVFQLGTDRQRDIVMARPVPDPPPDAR